MAWNTPNDQKPSDHDPWTGEPKKDAQPKQNQGPPLLEDLIKNFIKKYIQPQNKKPLDLKKVSKAYGIYLALCVLCLTWLLLGFAQINPNQEGLLFHWGQYKKSLPTGLHWYPWGIDHVKIYDRSQSLQEMVETDIVSQDANLAHIQIKLIYHINTAKNYALNFSNPHTMLQTIAANVLVQTAASNKLDAILANDKTSSFNKQLQQNLAQTLIQQQLGIQLDQVSLTDIAVPTSVKETFDKINALYDQQNTQKQQAADYESDHLPEAQTKVEHQIADAKHYATQAKLKALQDVADFMAIFPIYKEAPNLTRYRLYNQTMQEILSKTTHVVVDEKISGAAIYLPPSNNTNNGAAPATSAVENTTAPVAQSDTTPDSGSTYGDVKGGY